MNHYLQGIPGSQTLPTETCLVLPRFQPSYMSQIIRCGGLSTKSLTLSEMTGAKNGKSPEMQPRRTYAWWEYRMVNKETQPYTRSSLFPRRSPLPPLWFSSCVFFFFLLLSSSMGFVNNKKRSTVRGKVKKLSKKFNNSRKILYLHSLNCRGVSSFFLWVFSLELFFANALEKNCSVQHMRLYLWTILIKVSTRAHHSEDNQK